MAGRKGTIARPEGEFRRGDAQVMGDGSIKVEERSSGPLTQEVYGSCEHARAIVIAAPDLDAASRALGCDLDDLVDSLRRRLSLIHI